MSDSDIAIRVENIGKRYRINQDAKQSFFRYKSLGQKLTDFAKNPVKALAPRTPLDESNSFWALKDVSFDIKRGEVVGIIGRNGAGKSTLLKILSKITKPTTGQIELRGRVGSLLEVGTGFHPELSGRDNIYLNGAILGMTRSEVKQKLDEIIAFSEIEKFLDTPVKHYSSGMYTRLAFAVAAHLDPEILVVDEVLAVGDAQFQKKCLGKMKDVASAGRTVLFVSHNLGIIRSLCPRAIGLQSGVLRMAGQSEDVIARYLRDGAELRDRRSAVLQNGIRMLRACVMSAGQEATEVMFQDPASVEFEFHVDQRLSPVGIQLRFYRSGEVVGSANSPEEGFDWAAFEGDVRYTVHLPTQQLLPGSYTASIFIWGPRGARHFAFEDIVAFDILPNPIQGTPSTYTERHGLIRCSTHSQLTINGVSARPVSS
jgi:lipopolysaccharide transport system ATP-binding protein